MTGRSMEVVNVPWIVGSLGFGLTLLLLGPLLASAYLQSVLTNVGTAIMLFGVLGVAERRLVKIVDRAIREPRTLPEAQSAVRDILAGRGVQEHPEAVTALGGSLKVIGSRLLGAGLVQCRPEADVSQHVYQDPRGALCTWSVCFGENRLRHEIAIVGGPRVTSAWVAFPIDDSEGTLRALSEFERFVFDGLVVLGRELAGQRRASAPRGAV
jgi:hypothetical protein